jgi:hypothetical protein
MAKKNTEKNPLQEEKAKRVKELLTETDESQGEETGSTQETVQATEKKPRKKRKKKELEKPVVTQTPEDLEKEGEFFVGLVDVMRKNIGVEKPLPAMPRSMFITSYAKLVQKYGPVASQYMPELMMVGACIMIVYDTKRELLDIRNAQKVPETEKSEETSL